MAAWLSRQLKRSLLVALEILAAIVLVGVFLVLATHYLWGGLEREHDMSERLGELKSEIAEWFEPEAVVVCEEGEVRLELQGGALCRTSEVSDLDPRLLAVFDESPKFGEGREIIYSFLDEGDIAVADQLLAGDIVIDRYPPYHVGEYTWQEDPYGERYWRFIFYSLRETRHLLYAYQETGDERYREKLLEIIDSFLDHGMEGEYAWDDYHGVAYRTMVLSNVWWKLRAENALPVDTGVELLAALERHGEFLLDEAHYEDTYNHSITQLAALLLLAVAFPDLDDAATWREVGHARLHESVAKLVDEDGVLVENSPFYHFYTLEKYWLILDYAERFGVPVEPEVYLAIEKMVGYATYVLEPDLSVPTVGASIERRVGRSGALEEIADEYPEFLYVLTQGVRGEEPSSLHQYYPTAGQAIMRSDWGKKTKFENTFATQAQLFFDVGPYRTNHSDLDALSFSLYAKGRALVPDAGLYTYELDDALENYFHGTRGHNTVMVDGLDQRHGSPTPGVFKEGSGYAFHSAGHNLYPGVYHQRGMALFEDEVMVVIDHMLSNTWHTYEQLFHLFPEASIETEGDVVRVFDEAGVLVMTLTQYETDGMTLSPVKGDYEARDGFCSVRYEEILPCYNLAFKKVATTTTFVTVVTLGETPATVAYEGGRLAIATEEARYQLTLPEPDQSFTEQSVLRKEVVDTRDIELTRDASGAWVLNEDGEERFRLEERAGKLALVPRERDESLVYRARPFYTLASPELGDYFSIDQVLVTDLPFASTSQEFVLQPVQEDLLPIVGYHHIRPDDYDIEFPTLEMHESLYRDQIAYMTEVLGCRWYTFADLMQQYVLVGEKTPERACVMNFDDGRKNHFTRGFMNYRDWGAVATFYVIADRATRGGETYMDVFDLETLRLNGNEIGSHTLNASSLTDDGYDEIGLRAQLAESQKVLQAEGHPATTFAYPRGDQNQLVVDLTKEYYLAARDTTKDNRWRDPRPTTASFDPDYAFHMHYIKPELLSMEELEKAVAYTGWWQFEEGYRVDRGLGRVRTRSSVVPTEHSFAVVTLPGMGDQISNKFLVRDNGQYVIELFVEVNEAAAAQFSQPYTINAYVDGEWVALTGVFDEEVCQLYQNSYYCLYQAQVALTPGEHVLSVSSRLPNIDVDAFRIFKRAPLLDTYRLTLTEERYHEPVVLPRILDVEVERDHFWRDALIGMVALLLAIGIALPRTRRSLADISKALIRKVTR